MDLQVIKTGVDYYVENGRIYAFYPQTTGRILNFNEEQRKNSDENWQQADEDIKPVGRIPRNLAILWKSMGILDDANELMKALERHPEYKRTEKQIGEKPKMYFDQGARQ